MNYTNTNFSEKNIKYNREKKGLKDITTKPIYLIIYNNWKKNFYNWNKKTYWKNSLWLWLKNLLLWLKNFVYSLKTWYNRKNSLVFLCFWIVWTMLAVSNIRVAGDHWITGAGVIMLLSLLQRGGGEQMFIYYYLILFSIYLCIKRRLNFCIAINIFKS